MSACIDPQLGARLERLDFYFKKLDPERQDIYKDHLKKCEFCRGRARSAAARRRLKGVLNMFGGFVLAILGFVNPIPIPFLGFLFVLAGVGWFFIGAYRLVTGKD